MPESLAQVVAALLRRDPEPDAIGLADALWLAGYRFSSRPSSDPSDADDTSQVSSPLSETTSKQTPPLANTTSQPPQNIVAGISNPAGAQVGVPAIPISSRRRPPALTLGRSMRALKRLRPKGRMRELDIDRTIQGFGATHRLIPIFGAAPERWFDVDLVLDDSGSGPVWSDTVRAFEALLHELSAFRSIRRWQLSIDTASIHQQGQQHRWPADRLRSPDHRRLTFVFSDITSPEWTTHRAWKMLYRLAKTNAVVLVSLLPAKLGHLRAVDLSLTQVWATTLGSPNKSLRFGQQDQELSAVPIPLVSLTPTALQQWTNTLMRGDPLGCDAVAVQADRSPAASQRTIDTPDTLEAARLIEIFQLLATPEARQIATLSASFSHVSLRVLRFISHTMVPTAIDADMAEVIISGVLLRSGDTDILEFRPGIREVLQRSLAAPDVWHIHDSLNRYVTERVGYSQRFSVTAALDRAAAAIRPFLEASADVEELLSRTTPTLVKPDTAIRRIVRSGSGRPSLSVRELNELAGALLDCFCVRDRATRDSLLLSLGSDPIGQYISVNRQAHDRADVINIVHAFAAYSGGLTILLSGIELFEPGTLAVERVRNLIARLEPDPQEPRDQFAALQSLLTQIEFGDADTLYWKAVGPYGPSPSGPTRDLASLARDLTDVDSGGPLPPLLVFLEMLAVQVPNHRQSLHRWIDRHAAHWKLDPVAVFKHRLGLGPFTSEREQDDPYLIVQMEPYGADSQQYLPSAWIQQGGASKRLRVEDNPITIEDLSAILDDLLNRNIEVTGRATSALRVELILPRRLINQGVDQLTITSDGFSRPLGIEYQVVVRPFERLSKSALHREWYRKWTWLKRNLDDPRSTAAAAYWILRPNETSPEQLLARFIGEDTPVFTIMGFPVPDAEKLSDDEYAAGVHGGVPIMLWCRDRHPADNFEQEIRDLLGSHSLRMIPQLVHQYRKRAYSQGSPDHLGRRLTLLWDDFDRKPESPKYLLAPTREAK